MKRVVLVLIGATIGALLTLLLVQHHDPPRPPLGTAPEKFIPAQTLQLLDARGHAFASLEVRTDGLAVLDMGDSAHAFFEYTTGLIGDGAQTPILTLYGPSTGRVMSSPFMSIQMEPEPSFWSHMARGKDYYFHSPLGLNAKPETVETMIPSEDVRLVDRERRVVAALGLGEAGEPGIALMNRDGRLVAILGIAEPTLAGFPTGQPKQWPTLLLFDRRGILRITLDLGPDPEPKLTIHEKPTSPTDLGIYGLDPNTGQERPVGPFDSEATAIPWLAQPMPAVALPITLVDERGNVVWRSP